MKLTDHSRHRLLETMARWSVELDHSEVMLNYLVHGFSPGSFFCAVLANDFAAAMQRSHPGNSIPSLKNLVGWILDWVPPEARGSYQAVDAWTRLSSDQRRSVLEHCRLIYSEQEEIMLILGSVPTQEPMLF